MAPNVPEPQRPPLQGQRLWSGLSVLSKRSFRSFATSSFEADDERSSGDEYDYNYERDGMSSLGSDDGRRSPSAFTPPHAGHDARPTSLKELMGWYSYAFAAEVYIICGISSFIPILLETLARENGVLLSDRETPCASSDSKQEGDGQCVLFILGMEINTASFAMYTFSLSVLIQALLVVSISCAADHGNYRKKLLLMFAWVGSFSVMAFIFVNKQTYILGAILTIISNTSFGASFVLLNSFLPLLVRYHPEVIEANTAASSDLPEPESGSEQLDNSIGEPHPSIVNSTSLLLAEDGISLKRNATHSEVVSKELELSTRISSLGIGTGYLAGLFLQGVGIGILIVMHGTTWSQRIVLFLVGLWWTIFTIPAAMWLRPRPGPPLDDGKEGGRSWLAYIAYSWKSLFTTIRLARRLLDIVLFLVGWFLISDAVATTSSTAILFAKTQLHMKPWALGMINVISTLAGVFGAFGWSWLSRLLNLKPHQTILVCIGLFELIPIYGLLGYFPFVQRWGVLGLQQPWEMYPVAAVYGFVLGGLSSYCRSLYGELIPPGAEAAFYALYAITDKGSSIFGPTIVGAIVDKTGHIRPAFWFLAALVGLPAPFIWFINVERGKREGQKLAEKIEGSLTANGGDAQNNRETRAMLADYDEDDEDDDTIRASGRSSD